MNQKQALEVLKSGQSAFVTGPAGTGKTHLLRNFIDFAYKNKRVVAVTASTGLAATHLNGRTIHSWAGIGIHDHVNHEILEKMLNNKPLRERVRETEILIIDEISMLHDYRFEMIDIVCRTLRGSDKIFGGLQVILSGDFFQLPPVQRDGDGQSRFAIYSQVWQALQPVICYLDIVYRQESGNELSEILHALREDRLEETHIQMLHERRRPNPGSFTELYCHNQDIDRINALRLEKIPRKVKTFWGKKQDLSRNKTLVEQLVKNCLAPEELQLKEDALVMFVKNDPKRAYINGTMGKVVGFQTANGYPIVQTHAGLKIKTELATWKIEQSGQDLAAFHQLPLKLAWAITVHKSQGMTLEGAFMDLSKTFEPGMGYVALSRLKNIENLYLQGFNATALTMHPEAYKIDHHLRSASPATEK